MIDDVLAELRAGGEVESEGEFTLDRAKAREKLRRFQLADPRAYVLELVQAASLKGATAVRFEVDSRDMVMELDGRPFTTADFDDIYGAALSRRLDHDVLARRQLAIGLGSAMALRPRFIAVESGDGKAGARLVMKSDEEDELEAYETTRVGTRIHVRERFTVGTFAAFFRNLVGTLAEEQLLRARCGYASFGIDLEGARLDRGLVLDDEPVLHAVEVEGEHARGLCGLHEEGAGPPRVRIIKDGVWIVDHELPTGRFPLGFQAIVQDHALRKDVSQSDIVRDAAYEALVGVLVRGSWRALAALAERMLDGTAPSWAERVLLRQLDEIAQTSFLREPDEPTGLVRALRRLPLWHTIDGRPLGLDEVLAEAERVGSIGHTRKAGLEGLTLPGRAFVVYLPVPKAPVDERASLARRIFVRVLGTRLHDVTAALDELQRREVARRAWRMRPAAPALPEGDYLCRCSFSTPGVQGELGIVAAQTDRASLAWVVDGCLLVEQRIELPWLGLRIVVAAEGVRPHESFEQVEPTAEACAALLSAMLHVPGLYAELARAAPTGGWRDACAMSFLESALRGDSLALVLNHLERPAAARDAALAAFRDVSLVLDAGLEGDAPHPTVGMPLWRTVGSRCFSLAELIERSRAGAPILAVEEAPTGIDAEILVLDPEERALLQPRLGCPIEDGAMEIARLNRRRIFLSQRQAPPMLAGIPPAVLVPIEGEGITGVLQLLPTPRTGRRSIAVLHEQRAIDTIVLWMAGDCEGWVGSTALVPTPDYRGVVDDEALDRVRAAVLRAFAAACLRVAERSREGPTFDDAAFLLEVLGLPFPGELRPAYDALRKSALVHPPEIAALYRRMYAALHLEADLDALAERLRQLARSRKPVAKAQAIRAPARAHDWAVAAVDVLFPAGAEPHDLARRVLRPAAPLAELPLLRHHDGRPLTLAAIRGIVERKQTIPHVETIAAIEIPERTVVLVDRPQLEVLRRVVGHPLLYDGSGIIAQARRRRELDARAKVDSIALAPGAALVSMRLDQKRGRIEGEVGLPTHHPGDPSRSPRVRIAAHVERTPIGQVELDDRSAWLVAAVGDDRLQLTPDHAGVARDKTLDAVVTRCESRWPTLIEKLLAAWDELPGATRKAAWYHVLDFLVAHRPALLRDWEQAEELDGSLDEALAKAATLPAFTTAGGGSLALVALVRAHQRHDRLDVLPAPYTAWGPSPLPPERPVVCADAYELAALRQLVPQVEPVEASWARWQARARQRAAAPPARMLPDEAVLVWYHVVAPGLQGRLAIPVAGQPLTIELCAEGKVIAARSLAGVLPCWGSVAGAGVQPDEGWTDAIVDGFALQGLRQASHALYGALARWLDAHEEHPEHGRAASLVSVHVIALRRAERAGPLPDPQARLLDALRSARVLALPNGRRISLETALQQQPGELAHLDLWDAAAHRLQRRYARAEAPASSTDGAATPPPKPEAALLEALRAELRLVRGRDERLLTDAHLDRIHVRSLGSTGRAQVVAAGRHGIIVNRDHPVVQRAIAELHADPVWGSYVASTIYTALNVQLAEITDADERTFLELHAGLVAGR